MKLRYKVLIGVLLPILLGFIVPERKVIPVQGATSSDWNSNTFWYEPWGSSGVHKGIDIFAKKGTPVIASADMIILYRGMIRKGGNVVLGLGPKWRLHYFAHLDKINDDMGLYVPAAKEIGSVGDTGNALGKQAHLHFSLLSLIPIPWLADGSSQGYKKIFYLNPVSYFSN